MCHVIILMLLPCLCILRSDLSASAYYERFVQSIDTQQKRSQYESTIKLSDESTWTLVLSLKDNEILADLYDSLEEGRAVGIKGARYKAAYRIWYKEGEKIDSYPVRITNETRQNLPRVLKVDQVELPGWFSPARYHLTLSDGSVWELSKGNDVHSVECWEEGDQVLISPCPVNEEGYRLINGRRFRSDRQLFNPVLVTPPAQAA